MVAKIVTLTVVISWIKTIGFEPRQRWVSLDTSPPYLQPSENYIKLPY